MALLMADPGAAMALLATDSPGATKLLAAASPGAAKLLAASLPFFTAEEASAPTANASLPSDRE